MAESKNRKPGLYQRLRPTSGAGLRRARMASKSQPKAPGATNTAAAADTRLNSPSQKRKPFHQRSPSNPVDYMDKNVWNIVHRCGPSKSSASSTTRTEALIPLALLQSATNSRLHAKDRMINEQLARLPRSDCQGGPAAAVLARKRLALDQYKAALSQTSFAPALNTTQSRPRSPKQTDAQGSACTQAFSPAAHSQPRIRTSPPCRSQLSAHAFSAEESLRIDPFQEAKACAPTPSPQSSSDEPLGFRYLAISCAPERTTMTLTVGSKGSHGVPAARQPPSLHSYQMLLVKEPSPRTSSCFPLLAELTISPVVSGTKGSAADFSSTRRFSFAFEASYVDAHDAGASATEGYPFAATGLGRGKIMPEASDAVLGRHAAHFIHRLPSTATDVVLSRTCLVQLMVRNPQDGCVADIFVLRLELADMPANSRTIIRQKSYRTQAAPSADSPGYLTKMIEMPLVRMFDPSVQRQRIKLAGPVAVAFSFNRSKAASLRSPRKDSIEGVEAPCKTTTTMQFPSEAKYFSLNSDFFLSRAADSRFSSCLRMPHGPALPQRASRAMSVQIGRSGSDAVPAACGRTFQHGSLCL